MNKDEQWNNYANYVIDRTIHDCLRTTFKHSPPRTLECLTKIILERVAPLLWEEGVAISRDELLSMFEDWFIRVGRFRSGQPLHVRSSDEKKQPHKSDEEETGPVSPYHIHYLVF